MFKSIINITLNTRLREETRLDFSIIIINIEFIILKFFFKTYQLKTVILMLYVYRKDGLVTILIHHYII